MSLFGKIVDIAALMGYNETIQFRKGGTAMAVLDGCGAKSWTPTVEERPCPTCGEILEVFSKDGVVTEEVKCPKCGLVIEAGKAFPQ